MDEKSTETHYPGDAASVPEIMELANAYNKAALALFESGARGRALNCAPARLCSIHAVELYLNAFLRSRGVPNCQIRARMHNLADEDFVTTLVLRRKTARHLEAITKKREYLITRYGPEVTDGLTEITRLKATLGEVSMKTARVLSCCGADIAAQ